MLLVADPEPIRAVLVDANAALVLDWRPETVGGVADHLPEIRVDDVEHALLPGLERMLPLREPARHR